MTPWDDSKKLWASSTIFPLRAKLSLLNTLTSTSLQCLCQEKYGGNCEVVCRQILLNLFDNINYSFFQSSAQEGIWAGLLYIITGIVFPFTYLLLPAQIAC
jgi:hypothetical protein